jgi:hypothetical protein
MVRVKDSKLRLQAMPSNVLDVLVFEDAPKVAPTSFGLAQ